MIIQAANLVKQAQLGTGYDIFKEEFVGLCVRGEVIRGGQPQSLVSFDRSVDEREMASSLGFDFKLRARYGLFFGTAAAAFASSSVSSEYSEAAIFSNIITFKNEILNFTGLTPDGETAKGGEGPFAFDNWHLTCGHEFVSQITLGAKLFASVKIEFATREEKMRFNAEASIIGPPGQVKTALEFASKNFGKRASVSVRAFQLGGDVRRLNNIFAANGAERSPVIEIGLENPDAINQFLDAVVKYATEDFPNQVNPNFPSNSPSGPAFLSYITSPYQEIAIFSPPPIIEKGVTLAREDLSNLFEINAKRRRRLNSLLNGPIRLSRRQRERMDGLSIEVSRNLELINKAAIVCYTNAIQAVAEVANLQEQLKTFSDEDFEIELESFAQWYDTKDLPGTLVVDKQAINGIVDRLKGDFVNFNDIDDKGAAIEGRIETIRTLDINDGLPESSIWTFVKDNPIEGLTIRVPISNFEKFQHFKSLKSLVIVNGGGISNLSPLTEFTQLQEFGGRNNRINDLSPLASLTELTTLALDGNQITDISPLANLKNLKTLSISFNPLQSLNSLVGLSNLEFIFFGANHDKPFSVQISDVKALGEMPQFNHLFPLVEDSFVVFRSDGWQGTWLRRNQSNIFDIQWFNPFTGEQANGIGHINNVMTGDFFIQLEGSREGEEVLPYLGDKQNSPDFPTVIGGSFAPNTDVTWTARRG